MTGWQILAYCLVSASGALAFMTLVANEIEQVTGHLHLLEVAERKALQRRHEAEMFGVAVAEEVA